MTSEKPRISCWCPYACPVHDKPSHSQKPSVEAMEKARSVFEDAYRMAQNVSIRKGQEVIAQAIRKLI